MILKPGDVFGSRNPQSLGKIINFVQKVKSKDNRSEYGHTGIILDSTGLTMEALNTISTQNIFSAYKGDKVIIARWHGMNKVRFMQGFESIMPHIGHTYPYYRLLMHFMGWGKYIHFDTPVCSELTAKFLISAGATCLSGQNYWGVNPDDLIDEWRVSKHFEIIFEGVIE